MYSMIISLNLYNKYFKSIIFIIITYTKDKKIRTLNDWFEINSFTIKLYPYIETNRNRTYIGTLSKYYSNQLNYSFYNYIHIYIYIYGVNENWTHIYCMQHNCSTNLTITPLFILYVRLQ